MPAKWLRTIADVLRDYHRQPEYKFLGGGWNEEGVLRRRHVFADTIEDIGKESDGWEEDAARTEERDAVLIYPSSSLDRDRMIELIKSVGKRVLKKEAQIGMRTIDAAWVGRDVADEDLKRMADAAERIISGNKKRDQDNHATVAWLRAKRNEIGLTALSKMLGVDAANLGKVISEERKVGKRMVTKIEID